LPPCLTPISPEQATDCQRTGVDDPVRGDETPAAAGASRGADEGTRTLDLLHGKQTL
jgi:hypothetical protein